MSHATADRQNFGCVVSYILSPRVNVYRRPVVMSVYNNWDSVYQIILNSSETKQAIKQSTPSRVGDSPIGIIKKGNYSAERQAVRNALKTLTKK